MPTIVPALCPRTGLRDRWFRIILRAIFFVGPSFDDNWACPLVHFTHCGSSFPSSASISSMLGKTFWTRTTLCPQGSAAMALAGRSRSIVAQLVRLSFVSIVAQTVRLFDAYLARERLLHQPLLLGSDGVKFLLKQKDFPVGGVWNRSDLTLLC